MYNTNQQIPLSRKDMAIREFFSQPKFLWIGILNFLNFFFSVFTGNISLKIFNSTFFDYSGIYIPKATMSFLNILVTSGLVVLSIPSILTAIAYLLLHLNAKNPAKNFKAPTTILNILSIISFAFSCVFAGFIILLFIIMGMAFFLMPTSNSDFVEIGLGIYLVLLVLYLILIAVLILIAYVYMKYTASLKKSTTTDEISTKGIKGYSVLLIISIISLCFSSLSSIASFVTSASTGLTPLYGLYTLATLAVSFVQCILLYQFVSGFGKILEKEKTARLFEASHVYAQNNSTSTEATKVATNICRHCGNPINEDDYFCIKCGTRKGWD